jgi:hypothetical protein
MPTQELEVTAQNAKNNDGDCLNFAYNDGSIVYRVGTINPYFLWRILLTLVALSGIKDSERKS